ncbi:MAG: hypothetical protein ABIT01_09715 [Thermoanaerobaculia bacterium]
MYAPVASQLLFQIRHYDERWGRQYASVGAVAETIRTYLIHPAVVGRVLGIAGPLLFSFLVLFLLVLSVRRSRPVALPIAVVLGAVTAFFGICLLLRTPLIRSTAFVVVPLAFSAVYLFCLSTPEKYRSGAAAAALLVASFIAAQTHRTVVTFAYLPHEQWQEMGGVLHDTFPEHTPFFVNEHAAYLSGYLSPGYVHASGFDPTTFERGEELYLDTPNEDLPGARVDGTRYAANAIEYRIPQRRADHEALWFCPPAHAFIRAMSGVEAGGGSTLTDRDLETGTNAAGRSLTLWLEPRRRYRSLVVVTAPRTEASFSVRGTSPSGAALLLGSVRHSRNVFLLNLRDQPAPTLLLEAAGESSTLPPIREVWAYPVPGTDGR